MNKHYLAAVVVAMAMAGTAYAQTPDQKVRVVETYGDIMGQYQGVSAKDVSYYNAKGQTVALVEYKADLSGAFLPVTYTMYEYDANDHLVKTWSQSYRAGMGLRLDWQASQDTTYYSYDAVGNLVGEKNIRTNDSIAYEYDAAGNLVRKSRLLPDYYGQYGGEYHAIWTEKYEDFISTNCPQKIVGDGDYESYKFTAYVTYDEAGNMTEKKTYSVSDQLTKTELWTYDDNGMLTLFESYNGEPNDNPTRRTTYTVESTDPLRIRQKSLSGLPTVTEYFTPDPATAPELTLSLDKEKPNTVILSFTATKIDGVQNVAYDIFRHAIKIARVYADDAVDGMITYVDECAPNGSYDYMVQAVDADADTEEDDPLNSFGKGMNTSERIRVDLDTELPLPTNIRVINVEYVSGECFVTLKWDEPAEKDAYQLQSYNIYYEGMRVPFNSEATASGVVIEPITGNTFRMSLGKGNASSKLSENIFIEAIYKLGIVTTDVVTVTNKVYDMSKLLLRSSEKYGNVMGDVSSDKISATVVNYYNADNQMSASVRYGANVQTGELTPTSYDGVLFNEAGKPVKVFSQQYGTYDGLDNAYLDASDSTYYKYDAAGNLIMEKDFRSGDSLVYEYDDQNRKISYYRYVPEYFTGELYLMESQKYSDFDANGMPQTVKGDGKYDSYRITEKITYDNKGNMLTKETYNISDVLTQKEYWTYEIGVPALYELNKVKSVNDDNGDVTYEETPSKRTVYTVVGSEPLRIKEETFEYAYNAWTGVPYFTVNEYYTPDGTTAPELDVEPVADDFNSLRLTFDATKINGVANVAYDIFRHGIRIARLSAADAEAGQLTYVDKNVSNGYYDYFVQAVDADNDADEALNSYGHGMNVSNTVREVLYTELPVVANIRVTNVEYVDGECFATVEWDAPADNDTYLFKYYNVFADGLKSPLNVKMDDTGMVLIVDPILTNSYRLSLGMGNSDTELSEKIYVQSVYTLGKANSETVEVKNKVTVTEGIDGVGGGNCIRFSNGTLTAGEGSVFDVYSAGGIAIAVGCQGTVELGNRPAGLYIVKVRKNGETTTHKIVLRAND